MSSTKKLKAAHKAFLATLAYDAQIRVVHTASLAENNGTHSKDKSFGKSTRSSVGIRRK